MMERLDFCTAREGKSRQTQKRNENTITYTVLIGSNKDILNDDVNSSDDDDDDIDVGGPGLLLFMSA